MSSHVSSIIRYETSARFVSLHPSSDMFLIYSWLRHLRVLETQKEICIYIYIYICILRGIRHCPWCALANKPRAPCSLLPLGSGCLAFSSCTLARWPCECPSFACRLMMLSLYGAHLPTGRVHLCLLPAIALCSGFPSLAHLPTGRVLFLVRQLTWRSFRGAHLPTGRVHLAFRRRSRFAVGCLYCTLAHGPRALSCWSAVAAFSFWCALANRPRAPCLLPALALCSLVPLLHTCPRAACFLLLVDSLLLIWGAHLPTGRVHLACCRRLRFAVGSSSLARSLRFGRSQVDPAQIEYNFHYGRRAYLLTPLVD